MLASLIAYLLSFIAKVFTTLIQFLLVVVLGLTVAVLFALPWLLRAAAYLGFTSIETIYAPYSPAIPVIALQFAVILVSVGWVIVVLSKTQVLFGAAW